MDNYIEKVLRTESNDFSKIATNMAMTMDSPSFIGESYLRLLHGSMGLVTEAGELQDILKKRIFYGKELDRAHILEELGDICWYLAILMDEVGTNFDEVQQKNIAKLQVRYPEKFTEENAVNRNLTNEAIALTTSIKEFTGVAIIKAATCIFCGQTAKESGLPLKSHLHEEHNILVVFHLACLDIVYKLQNLLDLKRQELDNWNK